MMAQVSVTLVENPDAVPDFWIPRDHYIEGDGPGIEKPNIRYKIALHLSLPPFLCHSV